MDRLELIERYRKELDDRSMYTAAIAFEEIKGWIDADKDNDND